MTTTMFKATVSVLLLVAFAPQRVDAQVATAATGTVGGTVSDASGAVVADAEVILIATESGNVRTTKTARDGRYLFPGILPGSYSVMVTKTGFRQAALRELSVSVARTHVVDVALELGQVTETVEVVGAASQVELQKTDASIGNVIDNQRLMRLPSANRDASSYFELQPGVAPRRTANSGGAVAGARSDQVTWMLDGMDISDNNQGRLGGDLALAAPAIPVPSETVEEFRTTVSSPNATFGRAAGGQFTLVTKRGSNQWNGSAYEYHQNDALNANTWDRKRRGQAKPELRDNRFGVTFGGPLQRDRSFFFFGYEGRRFPRSEEFSRIVPMDSLRKGTLRFRDASGNVVDYDLSQSTRCGDGTQLCDPRRLGISPVVGQMFNAMPAGNDTSLGDGLNTTGFRDVVPTDLNTNYFVLRLDHTLNPEWRVEGRFSYAWSEVGLSTPLDLRGGRGNIVSQGSRPDRLRSALAGLVGQISPTLLNEFRFGWTKPLWKEERPSPVPLVPGTNIALDFARMDEPVDQFPRNRFQYFDEETFQFINNLTWLRGAHTIQTGGSARQIQFINTRGDKFAAFNAIVGQLRGGPFFTVAPANRPPTCGASVSTNCLRPEDVSVWGDLYAGTLGIIDSIAVMAVRDGDLNNLPIGTPLQNDASQFAYELYFNDTWQLRPTLTLSYGLLYSWQTPVVEKLGRQTILVNSDTCNTADLTACDPISPQAFLDARREAADAGQIFNPQLAYVPVRSAGRESVYKTDWSNVSPRVSLAWNPAAQEDGGWFAKVLGDRKTVVRGGYGILYDRMNTVSTVIIPILGVGFTQNVSVQAPRNSAGNPFRIGVDGPAPIPDVPQVAPPIVPRPTFSELLGFQLDPDIKVGRNHSMNFSVQRQLPGNMIMEVGWIGRVAQRLIQSVNLNAVPFFQLDPRSGQTFAQAFDAVAGSLRQGSPAASIVAQPWFENLLFPGATQQLAASRTGDFIDGLVSNLWLNGIDALRISNGLQPFNNRQVQEIAVRTGTGRSRYNALFMTLRKRFSDGLLFDLNYTLSKSLDQQGATQNSGNVFTSSFFPDVEYGPSAFDIRHIVNLSWVYELPFGPGRRFATNGVLGKLAGGWSLSGIYSATSGLPLLAFHSNQVFGGATVFTSASGAIPLADPDTVTDSGRTHSGVAGSGGVGTNGNPATGGTGLNLFADPESAFKNFRHILLSQDTRTGRGVLRGMPHWNIDISLAKKARLSEGVSLNVSLDVFNVLNRVEFEDPSLSLTNRAAFGVITTQYRPVTRNDGSRAIQLGLRVQF